MSFATVTQLFKGTFWDLYYSKTTKERRATRLNVLNGIRNDIIKVIEAKEEALSEGEWQQMMGNKATHGLCHVSIFVPYNRLLVIMAKDHGRDRKCFAYWWAVEDHYVHSKRVILRARSARIFMLSFMLIEVDRLIKTLR